VLTIAFNPQGEGSETGVAVGNSCQSISKTQLKCHLRKAKNIQKHSYIN
jgi:hypothetical protein